MIIGFVETGGESSPRELMQKFYGAGGTVKRIEWRFKEISMIGSGILPEPTLSHGRQCMEEILSKKFLLSSGSACGSDQKLEQCPIRRFCHHAMRR